MMNARRRDARTSCPVPHRWHTDLFSLPAFAAVLSTLLLAAAPVKARGDLLISEFMAVNDASLNDEDGDNSDWIEIYNPDTATVNLGGWYLTDTTNNLTKWPFPATNLPPSGFLIVFASEKNRRVPGAPLHTNFKLAGGGEYLALVHPDGTNIACEYHPLYPEQIADVSYGLVRNSITITFVDTNAPARAHVPTNDVLGQSWTQVEFDDSAWLSGTTGVGYDRQTIGINYLPWIGLNVETQMYNVNQSVYVRVPFVLTNGDGFDSLVLRVRFEDGFVAYLNGVELARSNAPATLNWNSGAVGPRSDTVATNFVEFDLSGDRDLLQLGTNVLAFQALNNPIISPDLLLDPVLVATSPVGAASPRYFPAPTPGRANNPGVEVLGPIFSDVAHAPLQPTDQEKITVTGRLRTAFAPVDAATLRYRVMFGSEMSVPFLDDGLHGDGAAGDGLYGGVIPATQFGPGRMVRWYITAQDTGTNTSRYPAYQDTNTCPAYLGTVVLNPALTNPLPVFHWFVQNTAAADTFGGTRAAVFYHGEFYDNVFNRVRGASAVTYPKKPYKFDFNPGYHFRAAPGLPRVDEINLNATYQDKAYIRQSLTFETYQQSGVPACDTTMVRVERNGSFFSVAAMIEQVDETFLERRGLDRVGALYKVFNPLTSATSGVEKKTRRDENNSDLQQLISGVSFSNPNRGTAIFDLLDLPEIINYLAAGIVSQDWDRVIKNIYVYRDTEGTELWQLFPWDKDLTFGKVGLVNDTVTAIRDSTDRPGGGEPHISHPYYGVPEHNCCGANPLFDAVYKTPATREMFLRRLRTLMDALLQPPGTAASELKYEARVDAYQDQIRADAALDLARWGATYGVLQDLPTAISQLKVNYLAPRRTHLYQSHSVDSVGVYPHAVGIPHAQAGTPLIQFGALEFNPASANQAQEFIELRNPNPTSVDLSGWRLDGDVRFSFAPGTVINAGGRAYVSPDVVAFRARTTAPRGGQGLLVLGNYQGQLSARGESLVLLGPTNNIVSGTNYPGQPSAAQQFLRITELMYHPPPPPAGDTNSPENFEYIELKNIGSTTLNLTGVHFASGVEFNFTGSAVTNLGAGESILIVKHLAALTTRYGGGLRLAGEYSGSLDNAGERLQLLDASNEEILDFAYNNAWYRVTDGLGFSLVVVDEQADPDAWNDRANWRPSGQLNGSPGIIDPPPPALAPIAVSEVLSHTDPPTVDAIELHNPTTNAADVSGWFITDDPGTPDKFRIPDGTVIEPGGFVVFTEAHFNSNPGMPPSFAFSSDGDEAYLFAANPSGNLTGYAHGFRFGAAELGVSFGRHLTSIGEEQFVVQSTVTLGATNAGPRVGPVVISELMYHPPDRHQSDNTLDEFIELQNITAKPLDLFDPARPTNIWHLRDAVDFEFPAGFTLPAGGVVLLVSFDPTINEAARSAFRATYDLDSNVVILGPYRGNLANSDARLELRKPGEPTLAGTVPDILVDAVHYRDLPPWPVEADGDGASLHRLSATAYGNDPANWIAAEWTPGRANPAPQPIMLSVSPAGFIAWPNHDPAYVLQVTDRLEETASWRDDPSPRVTEGGLYKVSIPMNDGQHFYRLIRR